MRTYLFNITILLVLVIAFNSANSQSFKDGHHDQYIFKNGVITLANSYAASRKVNKDILGENRTNQVYSMDVAGTFTRLSLIPFDPPRRYPHMISGTWFDTLSRSITIDPAFLQIRINTNGKISQDWTTVDTSAIFKDSAIKVVNGSRYSHSWLLAQLKLSPDDIAVVDGKDPRTGVILFTFHIRRISRIIEPYMSSYRHDISTQSNRWSAEKINEFWRDKDKDLRSLESFYKERLGGMEMRNQLMYPESKFVFYFSKRHDALSDSSLEYRYTQGLLKNEPWNRTGHMIILDGLLPHRYYEMQVRYMAYPDKVRTYSFYTGLPWYRKSWVRWTAGIAIVLISSILLLLLVTKQRTRIERRKKERLSAQLSSLHHQLNPHFIFNAISSIQSLMNKADNDKANTYLSTFAGLLRSTLANNEKEVIPLEQEIKALSAYLQLEQLRFHFQYQINIAPELPITTITFPSMLLQPLVENAIKHGIAIREEKGWIGIWFDQKNHDLQVTITDNGKGFDTTQSTTGYGLKLTRQKIALFNQLHKKEPATLSISSNTEAGTTVHLTIKNWLA